MTTHYSGNNSNILIKEEPREPPERNAVTVQDYIQMTDRVLNELIEAEGFDCQSIFNSQ